MELWFSQRSGGYTELAIRELWVEVLKDPKKWESIPWLMIACLIALILAAILG